MGMAGGVDGAWAEKRVGAEWMDRWVNKEILLPSMQSQAKNRKWI